MVRKKTRVIKIGDKKIGRDYPVLVQSMTNTATSDIKGTVKQIKELEEAGCEIIRVGVPDLAAAKSLGAIKKQINIPLVADIHFSTELALEAINQGVDKIRMNPGNIPKESWAKIVIAAKAKKIPIRIGVNTGSLEKDILKEKKIATPEMMVKSALGSIELMEKLNFFDLVIALKAPDIERTVKANQLLAQKVNYPLHLGVTEAGNEFSGTVKTAAAFGILLYQGIGDTMRVSLSAHPIEEVRVGWEILKSLGLRKRGVEIVSCPTCARADIDVINIQKEVVKLTEKIKTPLRISVMGCIVNGLGEAREADLGMVGVKGGALIIKKGKTVKRVLAKDLLEKFKEELNNYY